MNAVLRRRSQLRRQAAARRRFSPRALITGAALTIGACVITVIAPEAWHVSDPFVAQGAVDDTVVGQDLTVRVDDAMLSSAVTADDAAQPGTWLAVEVTASATKTEDDRSLELVRAEIGNRVFHAAPRFPDSLVGERLRVGVGTTGWVLFELPQDIELTDIDIQFVASPSVTVFGSVVSVHVDDIPTVDSVSIDRPSLTEAP